MRLRSRCQLGCRQWRLDWSRKIHFQVGGHTGPLPRSLCFLPYEPLHRASWVSSRHGSWIPSEWMISEREEKTRCWIASCPTLCDPMLCSPPDSSVHGILPVRVLEWLPCPPPGDLLDSGIEPWFLQLLHCRWILYHWATREDPEKIIMQINFDENNVWKDRMYEMLFENNIFKFLIIAT